MIIKKENEKSFIGFDMDGVIIDHTEMKIKLAAEYGWTLTPKQTPSEIIETLFPETVFNDLKNRLYCDPKDSIMSSVMPGVKDALDILKRRAMSYVLISRRKKPQMAVALLRARGLWPDYFCEENVFFVSTPEDKNIKAVELGVTHYVDDEVNVLSKLTDVKHKFLFDSEHAFSYITEYPRVTSWSELIERII